MEVQKFDIDFVKRTRKLLIEYGGEYELSNLLNCTLGLIILPYEAGNRNDLSHWNESVLEVVERIGFNLIHFKPIKSRKKGIIKYYPETFEILLKKIRNGLAHQRIEPLNQDGQFVGVVIQTEESDLIVEFTRQQLESFAFYICDKYLNNFDLSNQTTVAHSSIIEGMSAPDDELLSEAEFYAELDKEAEQQ